MIGGLLVLCLTPMTYPYDAVIVLYKIFNRFGEYLNCIVIESMI